MSVTDQFETVVACVFTPIDEDGAVTAGTATIRNMQLGSWRHIGNMRLAPGKLALQTVAAEPGRVVSAAAIILIFALAVLDVINTDTADKIESVAGDVDVGLLVRLHWDDG